jgi:hypothetical protein
MAPAGLGLGGLALLSPLPMWVGGWLMVLGTAGLVAVYVPLWRRAPAAAVLVQAGGAVLATGAAVLWVGGVPVPDLLPWLVGYLVLTIAGERLELARVGLLDPRTETAAALIAGLVVVSTVASLLWPAVGYPLLGASYLALTGWLVRHDVARRTVRSTGLPRFMAACLLAGYAWLAVTGTYWLIAGPAGDGPMYDLVIHSVFLGFVISMIMAHAPVILPAVLRRPLPYRSVMYVPAALLHASLVLRVAVGDVRGVHWAWQTGGVLNIVALLLFVLLAAWSVLTAGRRTATRASTPQPEPAGSRR